MHCSLKDNRFARGPGRASVILDCSNKVPQTGKRLNNRDLFLTVLEASSLRSGCWPGQVLGGLPSNLQTHVSLSHVAERELGIRLGPLL